MLTLRVFSLPSLRSESDPAPRPSRFLSPRDLWEKNSRQRTWAAQYPRATPSPQRERAFARPLHSTWSASLRCERHDLVWCEWRQNRWQPFFLAASDAEEFLGSVTDPALLPSSSSRNARLRADEELNCIMTKAINELGLEWPPRRSHLAASWTSVSHGAAFKPPANARSPSTEVQMSSQYCGTPPLVSHPIFCFTCSHICWWHWRKKYTSTCLLWISLWPHTSARPQLSDGRRGWAIRASRAEPHLHSLDAPYSTRQAASALLSMARSSRPRCSPVRKPVWMQLHSGWGAQQTWLYAPP